MIMIDRIFNYTYIWEVFMIIAYLFTLTNFLLLFLMMLQLYFSMVMLVSVILFMKEPSFLVFPFFSILHLFS